MLKIAICEDLTNDTELLKEYISRYTESDSMQYDLKTYPNGNSLLNDLNTNPYDIIFMDIILKELNGIDIAEEINRLQPNAHIIYQSSNIEFFRSVYKTTHIYFLLKPIAYDDFSRAFKKALKNLEKTYITIKGRQKLKCDDIVYIELKNHDAIFNLKDGIIITERMNTKELLEYLPSRFVRCHKGYIINFDNISSYKSKKHFITETGDEIPIGKSRSDEVHEKLIRYWGDSIIC